MWICASGLVLVLLSPIVCNAQSPRLQVAAGLHAQSVGGVQAGGTVVEGALSLPVTPFLGFRPEVSWAYAPRQRERFSVFAAGATSGTAVGGLPHLVFAGASLVLERPTLVTGRWYGFAGAAIARGTGNRVWAATRRAFVPHAGLGVRPFSSHRRFSAELRYRYAPVWFDAPLRYIGVVIGWTA